MKEAASIYNLIDAISRNFFLLPLFFLHFKLKYHLMCFTLGTLTKTKKKKTLQRC